MDRLIRRSVRARFRNADSPANRPSVAYALDKIRLFLWSLRQWLKKLVFNFKPKPNLPQTPRLKKMVKPANENTYIMYNLDIDRHT